MLNKFLAALMVGLFLFGGYIAYTAVTLPNVRKALEQGVEPASGSMILGRDRSVIMANGKYQHKPVPLSEIPKPMIDALLATEDRRFYQHRGIDLIGVVRAVVQDVLHRGFHQGGSTLTQQLARNVFLSNERSLERKVKEALLALKLEQQLSKDEILNLYLNNVYFGEGAYGIGAAANIFFGKKPSQLTQAECALLAGLPQAPSRFNPFANPERALRRRAEVIQNLQEIDLITPEQAKVLKATPLRLNPIGQQVSASNKAPFFNQEVIHQVLETLDIEEQAFWQQSLRVYTTLDPRAQAIAAEQVNALSRSWGRTGSRQQAALLSLDDQGRMIAYVGGRNYGLSQFDRVSQAKRQAGSVFKVFVYTTALENGMTPLTVFRDSKISFGEWTPTNYDKAYHGYMTLARALAKSNNVIAVKVAHDLGPDAVIRTAQRLGVQSMIAPNLSIALGAVDITLKELTTAFSVINNDGFLRQPYMIEKIVDHNGRVLFMHQPKQERVLQRVIRDTMVAMMQGVVQYGTAQAANFGYPIAGKTGTTDDYRDAWFIGYTPGFTTGVWVGNDDNSKMPGITGGTLPARIWRAYMSRMMSGMPKRKFNLAYAQAIGEKDFFVYNLENLSASEKERHPDAEASGEFASEETTGAEETPVEGVTPDTGSMPVGSENGTLDVPPTQPDNPPPAVESPLPSGNPLAAPRKPVTSPSSEDRFFDFRSTAPTPSRYSGSTSSPKPRNANSARPPADPLQ